ncbi:MAG: hypothetical protein J6333_00485 [Planctomycetes bacterium]|nr:hypothetical protein [Planctomycetota bacterium]
MNKTNNFATTLISFGMVLIILFMTYKYMESEFINYLDKNLSFLEFDDIDSVMSDGVWLIIIGIYTKFCIYRDMRTVK